MKLINVKTKEILSVEEVKARIKNVSFPVNKTPDLSFLAGQGYAVFYERPAPVVEAAQVAELADPPFEIANGQYRTKWQVRDLTEEEIKTKNNARRAESAATRRSLYEKESDPVLFSCLARLYEDGHAPYLKEWYEKRAEIKTLIPDPTMLK